MTAHVLERRYPRRIPRRGRNRPRPPVPDRDPNPGARWIPLAVPLLAALLAALACFIGWANLRP